ncbi:orotidine-5'-phosphate decarboxylase [Persicimonas caeni]|uniref:Orotidine 5'-phosphate decarboxylase n=1 Tax=Persicimonas caeni TaxID=2292766 RepID=A0A4Y6PW13_PERCE|nr:orotidine-5'-phosphate decarboxylase [Persicimonas caeni]QDG52498.1 orotidine-5'-phosphate decarboxylase [Persicimonas caeni]QED33720.1 orotidine-5'-phosphate decarboxylase [Persicimonas caeni]
MNDAQQTKLREHVISALDVATMDEALELVDALDGKLSLFKVGSRMFTRYGPALLDVLAQRDVDVFLDLKFHDIPNTVAGAVESALSFESVFMMTVHASGGADMIARAVEAAAQRTDNPPKIVAVTALTSLSPDDMSQIGVELALDEWAYSLGELALDAGADGLVCSAHEAAQMRDRFGDDPLLVTPGIRPEKKMAKDDDQSRVMTPKDALDTGSDYLVIGRPIYQADDPAGAVEEIGSSL